MPDKKPPSIFEVHDNYYAWRNVQPTAGDIVVTERERQLVTAYINELEQTVKSLSTDPKAPPWPWETIDRDW